jgi:hypothetical protein
MSRFVEMQASVYEFALFVGVQIILAIFATDNRHSIPAESVYKPIELLNLRFLFFQYIK